MVNVNPLSVLSSIYGNGLNGLGQQSLYQQPNYSQNNYLPWQQQPSYDVYQSPYNTYNNSNYNFYQQNFFNPMPFFFLHLMNNMFDLVRQLIDKLNTCCPHECPPPPPPYEEPKILGSAGLFGDPQFGLFSPALGDVPDVLKAFESNIKAGQTVTLLDDPDKSGLKVDVTGVQVDPNNANSTGIGKAVVKVGNDTVEFRNNGDLVVNGQVRGNIKADGEIAPITLSNGAVIKTSQEIDGANGARAERFVITNGEYKITAALRSPHADSQSYFDMNFEELVENAADNANGYRTTVEGFKNPFGIVDLLKLEPGDIEEME